LGVCAQLWQKGSCRGGLFAKRPEATLCTAGGTSGKTYLGKGRKWQRDEEGKREKQQKEPQGQRTRCSMVEQTFPAACGGHTLDKKKGVRGKE